MNKHIILLIALLCQVLGVSADDKVYISNFSIKAGETKRIALCFDTNRTDITRLQGTVMMPAGLTVQNQSDVAGTYVWITGNDTRTGGALMSYNYSTGSVRMTSGEFTAGTGAVAYIDVMASSSLAENSTITISDFKVMNDQGVYTNITSENCIVTRDASGQGGEQSGEVSFAFSPESLTLKKGQTSTVDVTMTNSMALTGMQAKLTASDGLTVTSVTKGSRIVGQFHYNATKGTMASLGSISGNEGTVFTVGLKVDDDFTGSSATLTISGLNVTNASAQDFAASDITLNVAVPLPELTLDEGQDNSQTLADNDGERANVTLTRTLQTGGYNTFAVPFSMSIPSGWTVKELKSASLADRVLTLNFSNALSIEAGKPYLVKVSTDTDLSESAFTDVTISKDAVPFTSTIVDFIPTLGSTILEGETESILFLGTGNTLLHPSAAGQQMKGFRAYFKLKGESLVKSFLLNFGDGEETGIKEIDDLPIDNLQFNASGIYTMDGRRIEGLPTQRPADGRLYPQGLKKGVYIVNGKKTVIK